MWSTSSQYSRTERERRQAQDGKLLLGDHDYVAVKQPKENKWSTPYEPVFYIVYNTQDSQVTPSANQRLKDNLPRCKSLQKLVNTVINTADEEAGKDFIFQQVSLTTQNDHRSGILRNAPIMHRHDLNHH